MRRNLILVWILWLAAPLVYGDAESKTAKAEEFFQLAKMDETLKRTMNLVADQLRSGFMQQLTGVTLPPEQEKVVAQFQERVFQIVLQGFDWEKLKPAYVKLFAEEYTEAELDGIIAFYKSPSGQAMVAKSPQIMTEANAIAQERMAEIMPQLQRLMRDAQSQIGPSAQPQPTTK